LQWRALKNHNQTHEDWLGTDLNELGTGIFATPNVERGNIHVLILVPNVTYIECIERSRDMTFQWMPERVQAYEEIISTPCGMRE